MDCWTVGLRTGYWHADDPDFMDWHGSGLLDGWTVGLRTGGGHADDTDFMDWHGSFLSVGIYKIRVICVPKVGYLQKENWTVRDLTVQLYKSSEVLSASSVATVAIASTSATSSVATVAITTVAAVASISRRAFGTLLFDVSFGLWDEYSTGEA